MDKIVNFLFEVGSLRKIARGHRQSFLSNDLSDNISSHSYRVSIIGYFLAKYENADVEKVLKMCLFHDVGEARSGDQTWVHKRYVKVFENEILEEQLKPLDRDLFNIVSEYEARESLEAKIVKDADLIDQLLLLKEYAMQGNKEAESWISKKSADKMNTKTAREIYPKIIDGNPSDWWKDLWTADRR